MGKGLCLCHMRRSSPADFLGQKVSMQEDGKRCSDVLSRIVKSI